MAALRHDKLVALPSLSCALSSLPQATSLDSVSLHPSIKVLSKTASTSHSVPPLHPYMQSPSHADSLNSSPPLMMRKSQKPKFQA
ncbi:hypothetical protein HD554DRAFT_2172881 [Boletus coccyginus]|nr:hypothetical protein HD554DRAFT_2172881 [Boletus coccyginus]